MNPGHFRGKEDGNPYYSEPASLASGKKKKDGWHCVHSVSEIPPSVGGLKTWRTAPTTECSL